MTKQIERFGLPAPGATPAAKAVKADGWLYVSGMVPKDKQGDIVYGSIKVQGRQALENLMETLHMAGYEPKDVIRITVYLDDARDFASFNAVYKEFFAVEEAPARVCILASKPTDIKVELDCIAWKSE